MYNKLLEKVMEAGWWEAAQQESDLQVAKRIRKASQTTLTLILKARGNKPQQLAILRPLATWRLKEAIKRDLALNFVFKEQDLWAVARFAMKDPKHMEQEGFDYRSVRRHGAKDKLNRKVS